MKNLLQSCLSLGVLLSVGFFAPQAHAENPLCETGSVFDHTCACTCQPTSTCLGPEEAPWDPDGENDDWCYVMGTIDTGLPTDENGEYNGDFNEDTGDPIINEDDVSIVGYEQYWVTCHEYGVCEQCADICGRQLVLTQDAIGGALSITVQDSSGLPHAGVLKVGSMWLRYTSHPNKARNLTDDNDPGIVMTLFQELPNAISEGTKAYPVVSSGSLRDDVPEDYNNFIYISNPQNLVGEILVIDPGGLNQEVLNLASLGSAGNNFFVHSYQGEGVDGRLAKAHAAGELIVSMPKTSGLAQIACDTECINGSFSTTCGGFGLCARCDDADVCKSNSDCEKECWYGGTTDCGYFGHDEHVTEVCRSCYSGLTLEDCDKICQGGNNDYNRVPAIGTNTCKEAYSCNSECGADVKCSKVCWDTSDNSQSTCGEKLSCQSCSAVCTSDNVGCGTTCLHGGESITCAQAVLGDPGGELNCHLPPNFHDGNEPPDLQAAIGGGFLEDCTGEPLASLCGCTLQFQGADSYAKCARQGSVSIGKRESIGIDATWWVNGHLKAEDQVFQAGVLANAYFLGMLSIGATNAMASCIGDASSGCGDVSVANEPFSTAHLFFKVEPSAAACIGVKNSGLFFRWRTNITPIETFGICNSKILQGGSGSLKLFDWGEGIDGFFLDIGGGPFKSIHRGLSLNKLLSPLNLGRLNGHLPFSQVLPNGLPDFNGFSINTGIWQPDIPVNFLGLSMVPFDFTGPGGSSDWFTNGGNGGNAHYKLPDIDIGSLTFDKLDVLFEVPYIENLIEWDYEGADTDDKLITVPLTWNGWPIFSGHDKFQNHIWTDTGRRFYLPDFRPDSLMPQFYRSYPTMESIYQEIVKYSPPKVGFADEVNVGDAECPYRLFNYYLDEYFKQYAELADLYPTFSDRFKMFVMAFANQKAESSLGVDFRPFPKAFYFEDNTEKYQNSDGLGFVDGLYGYFANRNGQCDDTDSSDGDCAHPSIPQCCFNETENQCVPMWSQFGTDMAGNLSQNWIFDSSAFANTVSDAFLVRELPDLTPLLEIPGVCDDPLLGGEETCFCCYEESTGECTPITCEETCPNCDERRFTEQGAKKFMEILRNWWNMRNLVNRRSLNTLIAAMTTPGMETLMQTARGLPEIATNPKFGKFLSAASTVCSPLVPKPYDKTPSALEGEAMEFASETYSFDSSFTVFGTEYDLDVGVGVDWNYDLKGSMSPNYLSAGTQAEVALDYYLDLPLISFSYYVFSMTLGVTAAGDLFRGSLEGLESNKMSFYTGWGRDGMDVDMKAKMKLKGVNVLAKAYLTISLDVNWIGFSKSKTIELANYNSGEKAITLFDVHHETSNLMGLDFDRFENPPSFCSLTDTVQLNFDSYDFEQELTDTEIVDYDPCSPQPYECPNGPPDPYCSAEDQGRLITYSTTGVCDISQGSIFNAYGQLECVYAVNEEEDWIDCGAEEICWFGECKSESELGPGALCLIDEHCEDPAEWGKVDHCREDGLTLVNYQANFCWNDVYGQANCTFAEEVTHCSNLGLICGNGADGPTCLDPSDLPCFDGVNSATGMITAKPLGSSCNINSQNQACTSCDNCGYCVGLSCVPLEDCQCINNSECGDFCESCQVVLDSTGWINDAAQGCTEFLPGGTTCLCEIHSDCEWCERCSLPGENEPAFLHVNVNSSSYSSPNHTCVPITDCECEIDSDCTPHENICEVSVAQSCNNHQCESNADHPSWQCAPKGPVNMDSMILCSNGVWILHDQNCTEVNGQDTGIPARKFWVEDLLDPLETQSGFEEPGALLSDGRLSRQYKWRIDEGPLQDLETLAHARQITQPSFFPGGPVDTDLCNVADGVGFPQGTCELVLGCHDFDGLDHSVGLAESAAGLSNEDLFERYWNCWLRPGLHTFEMRNFYDYTDGPSFLNTEDQGELFARHDFTVAPDTRILGTSTSVDNNSLAWLITAGHSLQNDPNPRPFFNEISGTSSPTFVFASNDPDASFECSLKRVWPDEVPIAGWDECGSVKGWDYDSYAKGWYEMSVRAVNGDNTDPTFITVAESIHGSAPPSFDGPNNPPGGMPKAVVGWAWGENFVMNNLFYHNATGGINETVSANSWHGNELEDLGEQIDIDNVPNGAGIPKLTVEFDRTAFPPAESYRYYDKYHWGIDPHQDDDGNKIHLDEGINDAKNSPSVAGGFGMERFEIGCDDVNSNEKVWDCWLKPGTHRVVVTPLANNGELESPLSTVIDFPILPDTRILATYNTCSGCVPYFYFDSNAPYASFECAIEKQNGAGGWDDAWEPEDTNSVAYDGGHDWRACVSPQPYFGATEGTFRFTVRSVVQGLGLDVPLKDPSVDLVVPTLEYSATHEWGGDNCPGVSNPDQSDMDSDGIGDLCDSCPQDPMSGATEGEPCGDPEPCLGDIDGDGVCDALDPCPEDPQNNMDTQGNCFLQSACPPGSAQDADGDGVCDDQDNCVGFYNPQQEPCGDQDSDGLPDLNDPCPLDANNDADGDGLCGDVDACPNDAQNDADFDGLCADSDICDLDPNNDFDGDGLCGDVDSCPNDPQNDQDNDGLCANEDPCPLDANNDADGDGLCGDVDPCPNSPFNDADNDGLCEDVDPCPNDQNNDSDWDGHCDSQDHWP